jgi:uncharacterized protein with beta-barrel porin domain
MGRVALRGGVGKLRLGGRARVQRLCLVALIAAACAPAFFVSAAWADCQPDPATSGQTVTCSGTDTNGFVAAPGVNNLTVNVQTGATVQDNGVVAIGVNNSNTVTNNGAILGGIDILGIAAEDNNTITNSGTITAGLLSTGIIADSNNIITNSGTITLGEIGTGIEANANNTVVNSGNIAVGVGGTGIEVFGDNNNITNSGTITGAGTSAGIDALGSNNIITNNGTVAVGNNNGSPAVGIVVGFGSAAINNGAITAGTGSTGIEGSFSNTIINNGTITVGSASLFGYSAGIDLTGPGNGNNIVINNGAITTGAGGIGINTGDANFITNNGSIVAGANGISIGTCECFPATGNTVINNGTLDGRINLDSQGNPGNTFVNSGIITITDTGTPVGADHIIDGTFTQLATGTLALRVNSAGMHDTLSNGSLGTLAATLGGKLGGVVQLGLYGVSTTYTGVITTASLITGQFAQVQAFAQGTTSPLVFFTASATYHPDSVDLTLTRLAFNSIPGETLNELTISNLVNPLYSTSLTGTEAAFFANLLQATSLKGLDQISGEGTAGTQDAAFLAATLFMDSLENQADAWRIGNLFGNLTGGVAPLAYADEPAEPQAFSGIFKQPPVYEPSWRAWVTGFGGHQSLDGGPVVGSADFSGAAAGGALGVNHEVNPDLLLGLGVAASKSAFVVNDRLTTGTAEGEHIGAYGMQLWGPAYVSALVSYSHFGNATTRNISGVGPGETENGSFGSDELGARLEVGRTWAFNNIGITPFAAFEPSVLWQPGYAETSTGGVPGVFGLTYLPMTVWSLPTFLGAQIDTAPGVQQWHDLAALCARLLGA